MNTSTRWERVFQGFVTMLAFYKIIPAAVKKKKEIWAATWVKLWYLEKWKPRGQM